MNHNIPQYDFYKHKYGDELLIDVVPLNTIKKYLKEQPVHILTYYDITLITSGEGEFLIDHQANRVSLKISSLPGPAKYANGTIKRYKTDSLLSLRKSSCSLFSMIRHFSGTSLISIRKDGLPSSVSTRKPMPASPS